MKEYKISLYVVHVLFLSLLFYFLNIFLFIIKKNSLCFLNLSNILFIFSTFLIFIDLILNKKRKFLNFQELKNPKIIVAMTAYNDELSIGKSVEDFINRENVEKVIVIDNNSSDLTSIKAKEAGALVFLEKEKGYGACCKRALKEAMKLGDLICLVEGDGTFSGSDLKKFISYLENSDMVLGTRTTRELNAQNSQMTFLLQYGNLLMAKLMQIRFHEVRLTDMGCTYRIIKKNALEKIIDNLKVKGNHFSCEMILTALKEGLMVIEIPVTFKKRIGESKGVGSNLYKATITAFNMYKLIMFK